MKTVRNPVPLTGSDGASLQENWLDRVGRTMLDRPVWFAVLVVLSLVLLPVAVWLDLRTISAESLRRQANDLNTMISDIREYYSRNVVSRVLAHNGMTRPVHNYGEIPGSIPIPATLSIELGEVVGSHGNNIGYRFVSDYPFTNRPGHRLDDFEQGALDQLRLSRDPRETVTAVSGALFDRQIRMAVPVVMGDGCVACHNTHPQSPKKDWRSGDVRGIQSITLAQPVAANILSFKFLLAYLLLAGIAGMGAALLQWRQARQFSAVNGQLEETNSFLASISMKISKYLSPQVYKSIFSGERDAVIATERKKLTIFFSDIKDFTVTTERLQPEELTRLLNEYFTEMSEIALAHGATVDKFIGDAILAFFGDPETMGEAEDALACVKMALAMQKRLEELGEAWRMRGIEQPFRSRMGINTGYCNVGNFGSADRMDYTIIGAEANLAARLESVAEPGGIVLSYETWALVQEHVIAHPLPPITLKGISRKVVPYAVDGAANDRGEPLLRLNEEQERLKLDVDLDGISSEESADIAARLEQAAKALRRAARR